MARLAAESSLTPLTGSNRSPSRLEQTLWPVEKRLPRSLCLAVDSEDQLAPSCHALPVRQCTFGRIDIRSSQASITGRKKVKSGVAMENLERMNFTVELATASSSRSSTKVILWSTSRKLSSMSSKGTRREMSRLRWRIDTTYYHHRFQNQRPSRQTIHDMILPPVKSKSKAAPIVEDKQEP
jgi:hypothetical protein